MSIDSVMVSNNLIFCCPLLFLPSIFPSIRVLSHESALSIRWPKYWSFSVSPSNEYSGLISFRIHWFDLFAVQGTLKKKVLSKTIQKHQFFGAQPSLWSNSHITLLRLDESQAGIKIAGRNISNLRYADDTTLMAESREELKSL